MTLLIVSFIAGVLTVLAPCILPLLPIIIGGSVSDVHAKWKPFIITASLAVSVIVFSLLLKASTALIDIPPSVWKSLSGGLLIFFGVITLFPTAWEKFVLLFPGGGANRLLAKGSQKKSVWGDVLIGAALGPVFTSCSPTYAIIIATVLPQSFAVGFVNLVAYAAGLSLILLLIAFLGQKLTKRLQGAANPHGWFKKTLGVLFILVGLAVLSGYDKVVESRLLNSGAYDGISDLEGRLTEDLDLDFE